MGGLALLLMSAGLLSAFGFEPELEDQDDTDAQSLDDAASAEKMPLSDFLAAAAPCDDDAPVSM